MYIPFYFKSVELIDQHTYQTNKAKGDEWLMCILFDERLLRVIDIIRDRFGPMNINDWSWGGQNQYRGWRSPGTNIGATLSQHRFGRAADLVPINGTISAEDIRTDIINSQNHPDFKDIGGLEMGISWLHIDVRARNTNNEIHLFYP
jgi:hypothetical protein